MAQWVKNLPAMQLTQKTLVQYPGPEDPLEEEIATHSSILAWKIPQIEKPGWLQSMRPQKVGHNRATKQPSKALNVMLSALLPAFHKETSRHCPVYCPQGDRTPKPLRAVGLCL